MGLSTEQALGELSSQIYKFGELENNILYWNRLFSFM